MSHGGDGGGVGRRLRPTVNALTLPNPGALRRQPSFLVSPGVVPVVELNGIQNTQRVVELAEEVLAIVLGCFNLRNFESVYPFDEYCRDRHYPDLLSCCLSSKFTTTGWVITDVAVGNFQSEDYLKKLQHQIGERIAASAEVAVAAASERQVFVPEEIVVISCPYAEGLFGLLRQATDYHDLSSFESDAANEIFGLPRRFYLDGIFNKLTIECNHFMQAYLADSAAIIPAFLNLDESGDAEAVRIRGFNDIAYKRAGLLLAAVDAFNYLTNMVASKARYQRTFYVEEIEKNLELEKTDKLTEAASIAFNELKALMAQWLQLIKVMQGKLLQKLAELVELYQGLINAVETNFHVKQYIVRRIASFRASNEKEKHWRQVLFTSLGQAESAKRLQELYWEIKSASTNVVENLGMLTPRAEAVIILDHPHQGQANYPKILQKLFKFYFIKIHDIRDEERVELTRLFDVAISTLTLVANDDWSAFALIVANLDKFVRAHFNPILSYIYTNFASKFDGYPVISSFLNFCDFLGITIAGQTAENITVNRRIFREHLTKLGQKLEVVSAEDLTLDNLKGWTLRISLGYNPDSVRFSDRSSFAFAGGPASAAAATGPHAFRST